MSASGFYVRLCAVVGIAIAMLRRSPGRTTLSVVAVALAVLSVTLLSGLGVGVVAMGEDGLEASAQDIWITGDPVDPSASGTQNPIVGTHEVAATVAAHDDVRATAPIAMHDIYIGAEPDDLERRPSVGIPQTHSRFEFEAGGGFDTVDDIDENGRAADPTAEEIVLDPAIATSLDVDVGDTVYVGASRERADYEFTVVGTSSYYSQYLGSETVTIPLNDQQALAGTTGTDRATFITATLADDADPDTVEAELSDAHPEYDVRTSDDQVSAFLEERPLVIASGVTLVALAVLGGVVLTTNLFALVAAQQRDELAALRALGLSRRLLAATLGVQGVIIGLLGGLVGLLLTPVAVAGLNSLSQSVIGFDSILRTPPEVYAAGFGLAIVVGSIVAVITGFRAGRYARIEHLRHG